MKDKMDILIELTNTKKYIAEEKENLQKQIRFYIYGQVIPKSIILDELLIKQKVLEWVLDK